MNSNYDVYMCRSKTECELEKLNKIAHQQFADFWRNEVRNWFIDNPINWSCHNDDRDLQTKGA